MSKFFFILSSFFMLQTQALAVGVDFRSLFEKPDSLNGPWSQGCFVVRNGGSEDEDWLTAHLQFSSDSGLKSGVAIQWIRRAYEEENCQKPYLDYGLLYSAQLSTESDDLDLEVKQAFYVIHTEEVARALNLVAFCGINNWKKGVSQEVTGHDCDGIVQPKIGQKIFSRLKIKMEQSQQLFWGRPSAGFGGESPSKRFQSFEDMSYQKNRQ